MKTYKYFAIILAKIPVNAGIYLTINSLFYIKARIISRIFKTDNFGVDTTTDEEAFNVYNNLYEIRVFIFVIIALLELLLLANIYLMSCFRSSELEKHQLITVPEQKSGDAIRSG